MIPVLNNWLSVLFWDSGVLVYEVLDHVWPNCPGCGSSLGGLCLLLPPPLSPTALGQIYVSAFLFMSASPPSRTPLGRCGRVNRAWRQYGPLGVPEVTVCSVRIVASFCRRRGKLRTGLVFGVPPPLLSPRRIWFKGENQDGRRLRAGRKSWQLLRKVR